MSIFKSERLAITFTCSSPDSPSQNASKVSVFVPPEDFLYSRSNFAESTSMPDMMPLVPISLTSIEHFSRFRFIHPS